MSILDPKDMQKAQAPRPVGSGQSPRVPTHEGSQLTSHNKADVKDSKVPQVGK